MLKFFRKLFKTPALLKEREEFIEIQNKAIENFSKRNQEQVDEIQALLVKIGKLDTKIVELQPSELEIELNSKYPQKNVTYRRKEHDAWYEIDVRNYFQEFDSTIPTVKGTNCDNIALKALIWVHDNIKYVKDNEEYGFSEFWAIPYQTLKHKRGDCEDGAILLANILLRSGVPYYRIRLNVGKVSGGRHCYVTYCREFDNQFVVLDWCYFYKKDAVRLRPLHSEERAYYEVEFSWNQRYSFVNQELKGFEVND